MGGQPRRIHIRPDISKPTKATSIQGGIDPAVLSTAGVGLVWYDAKGQILGANAAFRAMVGYTQRELAQKRLGDLAIPDQPETQRNLLPKALLGQLGRMDCHWRNKKGVLIPTHSTFAPFQRTVRGRAISHALIQDASELKQKEAACKDAVVLIEKIENMCELGNWSMELKFKRALHKNRIRTSGGLRRILRQRVSDSEARGKFLFDRIHPEDLPRVMKTLQRAVAHSQPVTLETRIVVGQDEERILELHGEIRQPAEGQPAFLVGSVQDITDRKHNENGISQAKAFFEAVVDALPLNLAILDEQTNILIVNAAWRRFARANGFHRQHLGVGMNYLQVCESASARKLGEAQMVARALRQMINGRTEELTFEYPCHSPTEQRWFMLRLTPFTFAGELRIMAAHLRVTRLKQAEKNLEDARELLSAHAIELERRIDKRTTELKETIRSLEGVLYHVAHDLRAPLRAIEGFTSLLLQAYADQFDQAGRDYADRVAVSAKRMDALIADLLNFGKVCVVDLPKTFLNLNRVIDTLLRRQWKVIEQSQAEIEVFRPLPKVWANEWAVSEALYQLISNALKFARPNAKPHIAIWADTIDSGVRIWVEDNGIGIPREHLERVFRIFERLEDAGGSTGIGLAIVRKAVERMDGRVGVESIPGQGSRFWMELLRSPQLP